MDGMTNVEIFNINSKFIKCGEIVVTIESQKKIYALNCVFCGKSCLQLEEFAFHIEEFHEREFDSFLKSDDNEITSKKSKIGSMPEFEPIIEEVEFQKADPYDEIIEGLFVNERINNSEVFEVEHDLCTSDNNFSDSDVNETQVDIQENDSDNEEEKTSNPGNVQVKPKFKDPVFISAFLEELKKEPILWNRSAPNYPTKASRIGIKKRKEANMRIAKVLKDKLNLKLTSKQIASLMRISCKKYSIEKLKIEYALSEGVEYKPSWYYEKLKFLSIWKRFESSKIASVSKLTNSQKIHLIEILKTFPNLWDVEDIEYRFEDYKQKSLNASCIALSRQTNVNLTADELQNEIKLLERICSKEKERKINCKKNNEKFVPLNSLYENLLYLEPNLPPFTCPTCDKNIYFIDKFRIHIAKHGLTPSRPFFCSLCDSRFSDPGNFKVHLRRHLGNFIHSCDICEKPFASSTEVILHKRLHTGEKHYVCEICGELCPTNTHLNWHKKRKHEDKSFKCELCSKSYSFKFNFKNHMKVHYNIRDEICGVCGKGFYTKTALRKHQLIHEKRKKYVCNVCDKAFEKNDGLRIHIEKHMNK